MGVDLAKPVEGHCGDPSTHEPRLELKSFLEQSGAGKVAHGKQRSLLDHLVGVYRLLSEWGASPAVREAGLFHSIYGTEQFRTATTRNRQPIIELIGEAAEAHVFAFATLDRRRFLSAARARNQSLDVLRAGTRTAALPPDYWPGVSEMLVANYLEHLAEPGGYGLTGSADGLVLLATFLSPRAKDALAQVSGDPEAAANQSR